MKISPPWIDDGQIFGIKSTLYTFPVMIDYSDYWSPMNSNEYVSWHPFVISYVLLTLALTWLLCKDSKEGSSRSHVDSNFIIFPTYDSNDRFESLVKDLLTKARRLFIGCLEFPKFWLAKTHTVDSVIHTK